MDITGPFRVGDWTAEPDLDRISRGDERIHLRPQVMNLLVYLSERQGEVVHSEDLMHDLWSGKIVTDATLYGCIAELRNILNGASDGQDAIQTIPKKGYRLRLPVSGIASPEPLPDMEGLSRRPVYVVILAALAAAVAVYVIYEWWPPPPAPLERSIAVLPFDNMSPHTERPDIADGFSEEILNLLAQIESLKVIARHSSFSFKGRNVDIATIAKQLGVRYIVQGSVRFSGNRVRVTSQLIDAKDSSQLWSEAYDRPYNAENLLEIQRDIARAITRRLRMTLTGPDEQRLARVPTTNTEAYAAYLLGRKRLENRTIAELAGAIEQFSLAIKLDPQYADAYAGLSDACGLYAKYTGGHSNERCPPTLAGREQLARKALDLDPKFAEAWISLGTSLLDQATRMHEAETQPRIHEKLLEAVEAFERGLELNPNLSEGYTWYGFNLMWWHVHPDPPFGWIKAWQAGRWESVFDKGLDVDPLSIPLHRHKSWYPVTVSSEEEAKWHAYRMVEIAPDSPLGYEAVGNQEWVLNGRIDESIPWLSEAMEVDPQPEFPLFIALAYSDLGDPDMALAYLELANALTAPDAKEAQLNLLVDQAIIRLLSSKADAKQVAQLLPPSSQPASTGRTAIAGMKLGVFVDLATGRPADSIARFEVFSPECIGAKDYPVKWMNCPADLVRVYQELGDKKTEKALSDATVRRGQLLAVEYPVTWTQLRYAGTLATAGRGDAALDVLENLVSSGWRGDNYFMHLRFVLCCDVVFDALRDHERFRAIAATIEADMARQLESVREKERRGELPTLEGVNALIASARKRN